MNRFLYPLKRLFVFVAIMCSATIAFGQFNPTIIQSEILVNTISIDTISSLQNFTQPQLVPQAGADYDFASENITGDQWEITITPNPGVTGHRSIVIKYFTASFPVPQERFIQYELEILPTKLVAATDYVELSSNNLDILPLSNDFSSVNSFSIVSINQVLNGEATVIGDTVRYNGDFDNDIILYTIKDSLGYADQGVIYLYTNDYGYLGQDTIQYTITNNQVQELFLPNTSFVSQQSPSHGTIVTHNGAPALTYTPTAGYVGVDEMSYIDPNGNSITFLFNIVDWETDKGYVKDDVVYTAKNETIIINAYENDLVKTGILTSFSPELTHLGGGKFSYTPPPGFVGVKYFQYKKNFFFVQETGKISVNIGNIEPVRTINYHFVIPKDQPYSIDYNIPLTNYGFTVLNAPLHGSAIAMNSGDTVTTICGTLANIDGLVYTPPTGFTGYDEFDIDYCVNNNDCRVYKVRFTVEDVVASNAPCPCIGDCVWPGDANNDGRVSVTDLLSVGRFMGHGGATPVTNNTSMWSGAICDDWYVYQPNGKNTKHADSNLDGVVTADDVTAISTHYGNVHTFVPKEVLSIKEYPFYLIPQSTSVDSGDLLVIDIAIGNSNYPIKDVHGLAFGLNFNPSIMDSASFQLTFFDNTWFTNNSPTLDLVKHLEEGKIEVGYTRTTGYGVSGAGIIGQLSFIVEEDVHGIKTDELLETITQYIYMTDGIVEDAAGNKFRIPDSHASFDVNISKSKTSNIEVQIYPSPSSGLFTCKVSNYNTINQIAMYDLTGRLMKTVAGDGQSIVSVDISNLQQGIYVMKVDTMEGTQTTKVTKF